MTEVDAHLLQLLQGMTLDSRWRKADIESEELKPAAPIDLQDAPMSDSSDSEDSIYQPSPSASSSSTATAGAPPPCGCALLQHIHEAMRLGVYSTTGGEYLDIIFTHREVFFAYPQGHRDCAIIFSNLAGDLERRDARPDRDGDADAANAFRHEAWVIANACW